MKTDELLEKILQQAGQGTPTPTPTPMPGPRGAVSTPPSNIPVAPLPIQRDNRLYYQRKQEPFSITDPLQTFDDMFSSANPIVSAAYKVGMPAWEAQQRALGLSLIHI